jgi:20S proteasome alpha/beta subunit
MDEAIDLALKIMNEVTDGKMSETSIDMAVVELATKEFRKFSPREVRSYLERVPKKTEKGEEEE